MFLMVFRGAKAFITVPPFIQKDLINRSTYILSPSHLYLLHDYISFTFSPLALSPLPLSAGFALLTVKCSHSLNDVFNQRGLSVSGMLSRSGALRYSPLSPVMSDRLSGPATVLEFEGLFNLAIRYPGPHCTSSTAGLSPLALPVWLRLLNNSCLSNDVSITAGFCFIYCSVQVCSSSPRCCQVDIAQRLLATWHRDWHVWVFCFFSSLVVEEFGWRRERERKRKSGAV